VNHTRIQKEDHLPDWARRDKGVKKGDRLDHEISTCKEEEAGLF